MKQKYLLIFISIVVISLILLGCNQQQWKIDPGIKKILDQCDEDQKIIDMAIIPDCYLSTFKEHGWSESKVKEYIKFRIGIDIDDAIQERGAWRDDWLKYYGLNYCENDEECNLNEDGDCEKKEFDPELRIMDHAGCICENNICITAPCEPPCMLG